MGWSYDFKLHLVINDEKEILSFFLTSGNVDDRNEEVMNSYDRLLLRKCTVIESINSFLKNICNIEHL